MADQPKLLPLAAYADRFSVRPGERIEFKVSSRARDDFAARLVRVVSADPNPKGPGIIEHAVDVPGLGTFPSREQPFWPGSYAVSDDAFALGGSWSFEVTCWPTLPGEAEQALLAHGDRCLLIDSERRAALEVGGARVTVPMPLARWRWYRVRASFDAGSGEAVVDVHPVGHGDGAVARGTLMDAGGNVEARLFAAACAARGTDAQRRVFNGKLEAPEILAGSECVLSWDFAQSMSSLRVVDASGAGRDGRVVNLPTRAVTGSNWDGSEMCWRHAPAQYGAIHFHDDDIYDFGWESDFALDVPDGLRSGLYAMRISCGEHEDAVPFFVVPPIGQRTANLCVLGSTFTFSVYGNFARPDFRPEWKQRFAECGAYPWNPAEYPRYGLSTYNVHRDGSGICHASHRRPLMSIRPGYMHFGYGDSSALRHLQADTHLLSWLERMGHDYDVVTDLELHEDGVEALRGYKALVTGSHPEYHTGETLDAIEAFRDSGGKLCYLGGNGFYWRVALHPEVPGAIEVRRAEGGIRSWDARPGEYYHAFDGLYGGLWRRNGRAPQTVAGIGFTAQGNFNGSYYRRAPGADDPRAAWIFEGIDDELIGDFGFSGGGAAGFELDRVDYALGSPENVIVVASSEKTGDGFVLVPEERLTHLVNVPRVPEQELLRADMVYYEVEGGGAVFSTGSITFCGSLPWNDYDNNVSKLLDNVLRRFVS